MTAVSVELLLSSDKARAELASFQKQVEVTNRQTLASADVAAQRADRLTGAVKRAGPALSGAAAAAGGLTAALGEQATTAQRVVATAGQMVTMYVAGGPFGAAIGAATVAVQGLLIVLQDAAEKQRELARIRGATVSTDAAGIQAEVRRLGEAVQDARLGGAEAARQRGEQTLKDTQTQLEAIRQMRDEAERSARISAAVAKSSRGTSADAARAKDQQAEAAAKSELVRKLEAEVELLNQKNVLEAELAKIEKEKNDATAAKQASRDGEAAAREAARARLEQNRAEQAENDKQIEFINSYNEAKRALEEQDREFAANAAEAIRAVRADANQHAVDSHRAAVEKMIADKEALYQADLAIVEKQEAAWTQLHQTMAQTGQAAASQLASTFQSYVAMKIAGEEDAEKKATAAFLTGIGNQLVGIGIRSLFEGGAKLFNPVTLPIGIAEMAFGGTAIAAGVGLGAAGAAVGGGGGSSFRPKEGTGGGGVNGASSGQRQAGATQVVYVVNYGVFGPALEDAGRELRRTERAATRRGI